MAVLFVSEDTIKKSTTINGNVDVELLLPYIKVAQDIHIHQLLGTDLYDKIQADITGGSLTGNYKTFTDKYMREIVKNTAEYYATRLVDYLCNNNDLFPEYNTNSNGDLAPTKDTYFSGIVLDRYEQSNRITLRSFLDASFDI